ncbi:hypothetical protein QJS10_CPA10g01734 [Acorus calamus]|uniref:DNA-directed RNA polymerase n=1 Tax=Acorus calamus TaxID=4465 RepID=A0AAV9DYJ4_ACOCL|nr:hypothetical protein QJS10_CPA10g01734 [Acorus calamus]
MSPFLSRLQQLMAEDREKSPKSALVPKIGSRRGSRELHNLLRYELGWGSNCSKERRRPIATKGRTPSKVSMGKTSSDPSVKVEKACELLLNVFLANVPVKQGNFRPKCIYVAVMLRRMMDAVLNADTFDDKDYVGNKRLELSGQLISLLFEISYAYGSKVFIFQLGLWGREKNLVKEEGCICEEGKILIWRAYIFPDTITKGLEKPISTGNWDLKRFKMHRKGVSQVLSRLSFIAALGYMTKVSPQFEKTRKVSGPRALQPSQPFSRFPHVKS